LILINTSIRNIPDRRLDYDTSGLIILTNDGEFANLLMHPKNEIDKIYIAKIKGILKGNDIKQLQSGVVIDNIKTDKAKIKIKKVNKLTNTSIVEITIHEGKNHQIKKMFASLGYEVLKLKREKIAFLNLQGLNSGDYRLLNPKEVKQLYNLTNKKNNY
jgi:23S rRNA pseudouridine2605 synthase